MKKNNQRAFIKGLSMIFVALLGGFSFVHGQVEFKPENPGSPNQSVPDGSASRYPKIVGEIVASKGSNGKKIYSGELINPGEAVVSVAVSFISMDVHGQIIDQSSALIQGHPCPGHKHLTSCMNPGATLPFRVETKVKSNDVASYTYSISVAEEEWGLENANESVESSPDE